MNLKLLKRMKFLQYLILLSFLFLPLVSQAQLYKLSDDPDAFIVDFQVMLKESGVKEAIAMGKDFQALWLSDRFSQEQKVLMMEVAHLMLEKRFKVNPFFDNYISAIVYAVNLAEISPTELVNYLSVTKKVIQYYDTKAIQNYFHVTRQFFQRDALYYITFNRLYHKGGTYTFEFIETDEYRFIPDYSDEEPEQEESLDDWGSLPADDGWGNGWDTPVNGANGNGSKENGWGNDSWGNDGWDNDPWASDSWNDFDSDQSSKSSSSDFLSNLVDLPQPEPEGAIIKFENTDLIFKTSYDSVTLFQTSGTFMIKSKVFVGEGGRFTWEMAGLNPDSVYCELGKYNFKVSKPYVTGERAKMTYFGKLNEEVEGVFEFESKRRGPLGKMVFPSFKSYKSDIKVNNIGGPNLEYVGGFYLAGKQIFSSSIMEGKATIKLVENGNKKFKAESKRFIFTDSTIMAPRAKIVLYHQNDSVFHPGAKIKYNSKDNNLVILKDKGGYKHTPFFSSYFNMDINAEVIRWKVNVDSMDISILNGRNQIPAVFESQEYFNNTVFEKLAGIYNFHPLQLIMGYSQKHKTDEFYADDLAKSQNLNVKAVEGAMMYLMQTGFIDYDPAAKRIKLKRKAHHYNLSKHNKKDFDNLSIPSISPNKPNGTLNFSKQELKVRGIKKFYISEPLDVYIKPSGDEITLLKNRDFVFDGRLFAGSFEYVGKDFHFDYDSFLVVLNRIDSIKFNIDTKKKDRNNQTVKRQVDNYLVMTSGTLYINKPDNKATKKVFPEYPYFTANKGATVYFDGAKVLGGAYDRTLKFEIPPFEIDSLSSSDPSAITFGGVFSSGGIVPDFEEQLRVMPDNSLGFFHKAVDPGYPLYGGTGNLKSIITLDGNGLQANGSIDYLTTTLQSEKFILFMDSVIARGSRVDIREKNEAGVSYAQTAIDDFRLRWLPKVDSMFIGNLDVKRPVRLYEGSATLHGTVIITSNGMNGRGRLLTRGSEAGSKKFEFKNDRYSARNALFDIKSSNPKKPALFGRDVRLAFDLVNNIAEISPEVEGVAAIDFPYAQVRTSISKATWNLDDKTVKMVKPNDVDIRKSYFYTTRKELDSLAFNATEAIYDINQLKLNIYGIPFIKVADAKITPANNEVLFLENAKIQPLSNAALLMDTLNEFHRLFDGNIKIISRNKFEGDATYQFVSAEADTFNIKFGSFRLEEDKTNKKKVKRYTVASGPVKESDKMEISPGMIFKGEVTMYANKKALNVDGMVKLDYKTIPDYNNWIQYKSNAERQEVIIKFEESLDQKGEPLMAGLHYENANNNLYHTFITDKRTPVDQDLFKPKGQLIYDPRTFEYKIQHADKVAGKVYAGKYFSFNENTKDIHFEGPLNFIENKKEFSLFASGKGKGNTNTMEFSMNALLGFDFKLHGKAYHMMAMEIQKAVDEMHPPSANEDRTRFYYKVSELVGEKAINDFNERLMQGYAPLVSLSNQMIKSLMITDVNLEWSDENKAWYSKGRLGISNLEKFDIDGKLDGFLEIRKTLEGDIVNLFLQPSSGVWYYFNYEGGRLFTYSSNENYNSIIRAKSKITKAKFNQYAFGLSDMDEAVTFINRFRKIYLNIDIPYELNSFVETDEEDNPFIDAPGYREEKPQAPVYDDDGF
jgi:hypothetical protein